MGGVGEGDLRRRIGMGELVDGAWFVDIVGADEWGERFRARRGIVWDPQFMSLFCGESAEV